MNITTKTTLALLLAYVARTETPAAELPPDREYVVAKDGHLAVDGQRQRYWAAIGRLYIAPRLEEGDSAEARRRKVELSRNGTIRLLDRFQQLGFNAFRFWDGFGHSDYEVGDGSLMDAADFFLAEAGKRGFKVWAAGLNGVGALTPDDVGILDAPPTAEAWADAVRRMCQYDANGTLTRAWWIRNNPARIWDPRIEALGIERMKQIATHIDRYTGRRWCDDPVFAVWELSNEEWWMRSMVGGRWQDLPSFFRNQLIERWNSFLREKYGSDEKLAEGWEGLLPGESLERGTVLLVPMGGKTVAAVAINDGSSHIQEALRALDQEYTRDDFAPQRGSNVLEFLMDLLVVHKQKEAAAIKPLGQSTRLCPMVFDTGIGYEIQSQYLQQQADAVAHDAYVNGWGPDLWTELGQVTAATEQQRAVGVLHAERKARNSGPWVNWLLKPPGIHQGVPWLEHNKVEGKPFLCYETQIQQPAKYRADFPLRIAALASIQDWDWICWHYFQAPDEVQTEERPFTRTMDVTCWDHPQGYHYTFDEVQTAAMRAAGHLFRHFAVAPAAHPTKFVYGRHSLYSPDSMDYAGSYGLAGLDMIYTVYQHGVRIAIDPRREEDAMEGPVVAFADRRTHNPYTPPPEITFDWKKGYLAFDTPAAAAWTGLLLWGPGRIRQWRGPAGRGPAKPGRHLLAGRRGREIHRLRPGQPGRPAPG